MKHGIRTLGTAGLALALAGCGSGSQPADTASEAPAASGSTAATDLAAAPPAFAQCRTCHAVEAGRNGAGPSLHGTFGAAAASKPGFPYSAALKQAGITWDRASLDRWLTAPVKMVPGTRMVTMVPDPADRAAIIAYLETVK